jgi:hypothetical protein
MQTPRLTRFQLSIKRIIRRFGARVKIRRKRFSGQFDAARGLGGVDSARYFWVGVGRYLRLFNCREISLGKARRLPKTSVETPPVTPPLPYSWYSLASDSLQPRGSCKVFFSEGFSIALLVCSWFSLTCSQHDIRWLTGSQRCVFVLLTMNTPGNATEPRNGCYKTIRRFMNKCSALLYTKMQRGKPRFPRYFKPRIDTSPASPPTGQDAQTASGRRLRREAAWPVQPAASRSGR